MFVMVFHGTIWLPVTMMTMEFRGALLSDKPKCSKTGMFMKSICWFNPPKVIEARMNPRRTSGVRPTSQELIVPNGIYDSKDGEMIQHLTNPANFGLQIQFSIDISLDFSDIRHHQASGSSRVFPCFPGDPGLHGLGPTPGPRGLAAAPPGSALGGG